MEVVRSGKEKKKREREKIVSDSINAVVNNVDLVEVVCSRRERRKKKKISIQEALLQLLAWVCWRLYDLDKRGLEFLSYSSGGPLVIQFSFSRRWVSGRLH